MANKDKEDLRHRIQRETQAYLKRGGTIYKCEQGETGDEFQLTFSNPKFNYAFKSPIWLTDKK